METKICRNCHNDFVIEPEDFAFYDKIHVPPPTWCPECRFQRRLSFCNERTLYSRTCSLCGKQMIAMYPKDTIFPVYCLPCYRGDNWDPLAFGRDYDFSRPFFQQFKELKLQVPRPALVRQGDIVGSEYCNRASYNQNCYLLIRANYCENSMFSHNLFNCRDCADCFNVHKSELTFQSVDSYECYNVKYCQECRLCRESYFLFDCRNCNNCIGCVNLRNQQYHILNTPYSKEEYKKIVKAMRLDTVSGLAAMKEKFDKLLAGAFREPNIMLNCHGSSGNWLFGCADTNFSYQCRNMEHGKYLLNALDSKDCMDLTYFGTNSELLYETANCGYQCSNVRFTNEGFELCYNLTYCDSCFISSNIFGCVSLRNKEYCILNKKYSQEEYEALVPKIIAHMNEMPYIDKLGREYKFGEFFPTELSASAYNTTAAHDNFPLTREQVKERGFVWEEREEKGYQPTKKWSDLPESIAEVGDDILKEIILCEAYDQEGGQKATDEHNCSKAYRITPAELTLYRQLNIPLPRRCPNSRHYLRFKMRNPLKLWSRTCSKCSKSIKTSYSPDRPEIVYCESCYQQEVV